MKPFCEIPRGWEGQPEYWWSKLYIRGLLTYSSKWQSTIYQIPVSKPNIWPIHPGRMAQVWIKLGQGKSSNTKYCKSLNSISIPGWWWSSGPWACPSPQRGRMLFWGLRGLRPRSGTGRHRWEPVRMLWKSGQTNWSPLFRFIWIGLRKAIKVW